MLVAYTLGVAIVVGAVISLALDSWWFLIVALGAHFLASAFFLVYTFKALESGDKPDPVTEAHMEAEGSNGKPDGLTESGRRGDREVIH
jgi:membrane protein implicated in regulation of membrane protease activity